MSGPSSDDGRRVGDTSPPGEPSPSLADLRQRAPTGDHRAARELLVWARRRAEEILASLSPDSELLELLRGEDAPAPKVEAPTVRSGGTERGIPIPPVRTTPDPSPEPEPKPEMVASARKPSPTIPAAPRPADSGVFLEALPRADVDLQEDDARVAALQSSPVARVLPRTPALTLAPAPPARRHPRYAIEQPVTIRYDQWSDLVELCTRDISKGGMFVKTDSPPPLRAKITVRVQLPAATGFLELSGEVVHVMGGDGGGPVLGFGVQFDELGGRRRALLDRLVEHAREMAEGNGAEAVTLAELGLGLTSASGSRLRLTLTPEEIGQLNDLRAELQSMEAKDDLALLGLSGTPSPAQIDAAFQTLEAKWHPARWTTPAVPEAETLAMDVLRRIEAAYMRASLEARRRDVEPPARAAEPPIAAPPEAAVAAAPETPAASSPDAPAATPPDARDANPPAEVNARGLVGRLLERGGRLAQRLNLATQGAGGRPSMSTLEFNDLIGRGFQQLSSKDYRAAIATLQKAVANRPDSTKAQILLLFAEARLLVAGRKLADARAKYEEVLKLDPTNATAQRDLVMLACLE